MGTSRCQSGCENVVSVACKGRRKSSRRSGSCSRRSRSRRSRSRRSHSRRSHSRRGRSRTDRSEKKPRCRSGVKTTNPFLNYLRVFRRRHCGWPQRKVAIEGAKRWCKMSKQKSQKFYKQAYSVCKTGKNRSRSGSRRRSRSRRHRKGKRGSRSRGSRRRRRKDKCPM